VQAKAVEQQDNSNVSKILPVTTFRTIDLGGRKFVDPFFSIFCVELRVFFEVFFAPEYVQARIPGALIETKTVRLNSLGEIVGPCGA